MSNKATKELQPIFNALKEAEEILGKEMLGEIIKRLIRGAMAEGERDFLQNQKRNAAAASLGMTRDEYEKTLE